MQEAARRHHRITRLDGLRAFAIVAVFLSHAFKIRMLWIGVDLFFVLSGFLITGILVEMKHKDLKGYFAHFYERRVRRILPPYLLLIVLVSLVFGLAWTRRWYMYLGLTNYVVLFNDPGFMPFNPLWSLGVEEQFYLVWPFVVYFFSDKKLPWAAITLLILAPVFRLLAIPYDHTHQMVYMGTPFRMDCLAMGALLSFVWRSRPDTIRKYGYLGLIVVVLTPIVMIKLSRMGGFSTLDGTVRSNLFTYEIALYCATGAFLWGLGGRFTGILELAPVQYLGKISYTFYLMHLGALLWVERYFAGRALPSALAFVTTLAVATLSWYFLEKPILARGSRKVKVIEAAAAEHVSS